LRNVALLVFNLLSLCLFFYMNSRNGLSLRSLDWCFFVLFLLLIFSLYFILLSIENKTARILSSEEYSKESQWKIIIAEITPTSFTGMGILFTFLGLAIGLSDFNSKTVDQIAILSLIAGLKTAFSSSISGIISSVISSFFVKSILVDYHSSLEERSQRPALKLFENLEDGGLIIDRDPEINLAMSAKIAYDQLKVQKEDSLSIRSIELNINQIVPVVESTNSLLEDYLKRQSEMNSIALKEVMDTFNTEFGNSLKGHFEGMGQTLREFQQWNEQSRALYDASMQSMTTLNHAISALLNQEHALREERQRLLQATEQLVVTAGQVVELRPLIEEQIISHRASNKALEGLSKQIDGLPDMTSVLATLEDGVRSLSETLQSTHTQQGQALESMTELAQSLGGIDSSMHSALELQGEMARRLETSAEGFRVGGEAILAAKVALLETANSMAQINEGVGATRHAQESIAASMQKTLTALQNQNPLMEAWTRVIAEVGPLIQAQRATNDELRGTFEKLFELSQQLKIPLVHIDTSIGTFAEKSGELHKAINEAPKSYDNTIKKMHEGINGTFNMIDLNVANIAKHLEGTIQSNIMQQEGILDLLVELKSLLAPINQLSEQPNQQRGEQPSQSSTSASSRSPMMLGGLSAIQGPGDRNG
jgi:hypothetical protein